MTRNLLNNSTIELYLPGLWALLRHAGSEVLAHMPSFQLLLKRSDSLAENQLESEALILMRFGRQPHINKDVPIAALEHLAEVNAGDNSGFWFRADPVSLQEDQNYLMMGYPSELNLGLDEATAMAESINQHFAEDGWRIEVIDAQCWYLNLDKSPAIQTTAAWRVMGRDVFNLMPVGNDSAQWHAWLMEVQMLLFGHSVNEARIVQGLAPVSGLWLWGGGELPALSQPSRLLLRGNSLFMQGVSRQSGCEIKGLPREMSEVLTETPPNTEQLIMLEHARTALQTGDLDQGVSALKKLEEEVFQPLLSLLTSKQLSKLLVIDTPGYVLDASAGAMKKWWRRRQFFFIEENN